MPPGVLPDLGRTVTATTNAPQHASRPSWSARTRAPNLRFASNHSGTPDSTPPLRRADSNHAAATQRPIELPHPDEHRVLRAGRASHRARPPSIHGRGPERTRSGNSRAPSSRRARDAEVTQWPMSSLVIGDRLGMASYCRDARRGSRATAQLMRPKKEITLALQARRDLRCARRSRRDHRHSCVW
jgi:hypothetical protein